MFPQIKQIHRFVVEEQTEQEDRVGVFGLANGMGTEERVDDELGWEERRVCEYRQTGHLYGSWVESLAREEIRLTGCPPTCSDTYNGTYVNKGRL